MYRMCETWYNRRVLSLKNASRPVRKHRTALSAIEEMTHMPHPFNSTTTPNHTQSHTAAFREAVPS